jgi:hypothetical protein
MNIFRQPLIFLISLCILFGSFVGCSTIKPSTKVPKEFEDYFEKIDYGKLGRYTPEITYQKVSNSIIKVNISWYLDNSLKQDDWQVNFFPVFQPSFHWAPHLTPTKEHIIAQHVFRAPALILSSAQKQVTIIPDLDILQQGSPVEWYMDINAVDNKLTLGLSNAEIEEHVLYHRKAGAKYPPGKIRFGFYVMMTDDPADLNNPWRKTLAFYWEKWGKPLYESGEPLGKNDLETYVKHTYNWAFTSWKKNVWQEFNLHGNTVGAPSFIVNVTQSPNYPGEVNEREFRSIWNQAWFSSIRSAQGVYRYARRTNNKELLDYALKTKELALSFPQKNGFFPSLIATDMEQISIDGKSYKRSKGWETYYFGNSNRNPYSGNPKDAPFHILDMSWTAYLMLTWYEELEKDERLLKYATSYADALLQKQYSNGFFPGWLSKDSLQALHHLNQSPETSMSVTFLLKLYALTKNEKYLHPSLRAMQAVVDSVIPRGQWEDFETYWSCSRYGNKTLLNQKVARNNMFKQNNFSIYWTAEALLNCYKITNDKKYLEQGQRTLDELLMTQASWQPPFIYIHALGGFGVMNADGEWNDSRQSLFSELIIKYGIELNQREYIQRGLAALRASFVMMYCPENPTTKKQWEVKWNFFGEKDYGFMMENYGHDGATNPSGLGMGEFTIYDWGNGAAAEAYNRILDHYGNAFVLTN